MCLSSRQVLGALLAVVVLCVISLNPVVAATLTQQDIQNIAQQNIARKANQGSAPPPNIAAALNKHANVSASAIANAQAIVADAIATCAILNKARVENPLGNVYTLQPKDAAAARRAAPPLFEVTPEIAAAAALLAEIDAAAAYKNGTLYRDYSANAALRKREKVEERTTSSYWMAQLDDLGTMPFGGNASYRVFRNVNDTRYAGGAKGDGVTVSFDFHGFTQRLYTKC
jgi:hypothetical protein